MRCRSARCADAQCAPDSSEFWANHMLIPTMSAPNVPRHAMTMTVFLRIA